MVDAVIPVKAVSERVKSKNFREFVRGRSLFDLTVDRLVSCPLVENVWVSTDSEELLNAADPRFVVVERSRDFCNNTTPWSEVICNVIESLPLKHNNHVAWCHVTTPFFDEYEAALSLYLKLAASGEYNGLVTARAISEFLVDKSTGLPFNYCWGPWHPYSQKLRQLLAVTGSMFVSTVEEMLKNRYVISSSPYFYEVEALKGLDIDTQDEFDLAQGLYSLERSADA